MEKKEKIRKIYQKNGIKIKDKDIEMILKDKTRTKSFMKLYKQEEIDSMNYILGKPKDNLYFNKEELELMNTIDLFNRRVVEVCKAIYEKEYKEVKV